MFRSRILIAVLLAVSACSTTYHEGPKSCSRDLDCPSGQRCVETYDGGLSGPSLATCK
jgi:hypothetical protein